jgi:deoxyribodipyrimidine photolyase-related protein
MEVHEEATYVHHHVQKVVGFFLAMRLFAQELTRRGFTVDYIRLDDPRNQGTFSKTIHALLASREYMSFEYQRPDEYRVVMALEEFSSSLSIPAKVYESEHFLTDRHELGKLFAGKKRYLMETFYREIRIRYDLLMENNEPIGGRWNFDTENRSKLPRDLTPPPPLEFPRDVREITTLLETHKIPTIGTINPSQFTWPVTREEALELLEYFCTYALPSFGAYQDAMHTDHRLLFHSKLSFCMNVKLLAPLEIVHRAIEQWRLQPDTISLPQIEGFVRQIVGWREFMRGVYWAQMPTYKERNYFNAQRPLPHFFWDGNTRMNCLKHTISASLEDAYAHHIQRLMITGNFCALAGINPNEVDAWYLGIYADALEWVQLPNTRGMSQYADGGIVGTKPYVASANYINKMSNYCSSCSYDHKKRVGSNACPFNSLYWNFMLQHAEKLQKNPRIGMAYQSLAKMPQEEKDALVEQAQRYLEGLESC